MRLELLGGGQATFVVSGLKMSLRIDATCAGSAGCESLTPHGENTFSCTTDTCGATCSCDLGGVTEDSAYMWTTTATTLTVGNYSFDYCVQGGLLTVRDATGLMATLEPAHESGTPTPCSQRSASDCAAGSGCTWSTNVCTGTAPATCGLADYDVVPGCQFLDGTATCVGMRKQCSQMTTAECANTPACGPPGCVGGPLDCTKFQYCWNVVGCSQPCTSGMTTCEVQTSNSICFFANCGWAACTGTLPACDQLTELTCETAEGCSVQVTPDADAGAGGGDSGTVDAASDSH
jgi:hypothetical protein